MEHSPGPSTESGIPHPYAHQLNPSSPGTQRELQNQLKKLYDEHSYVGRVLGKPESNCDVEVEVAVLKLMHYDPADPKALLEEVLLEGLGALFVTDKKFVRQLQDIFDKRVRELGVQRVVHMPRRQYLEDCGAARIWIPTCQWSDILGSDTLAEDLVAETDREEILRGNLGRWRRLALMSDAFEHPSQRILTGDLGWVFSSAETMGTFALEIVELTLSCDEEKCSATMSLTFKIHMEINEQAWFSPVTWHRPAKTTEVQA